jgi:hypothetical protein
VDPATELCTPLPLYQDILGARGILGEGVAGGRSYRMKNGNYAAGADFSEAVFSLEYGHLFPIGSGTSRRLYSSSQGFKFCNS